MVTVASLSISLIMIIQVNALVYIIKEDISQWLDNALGADIILRSPSPINQTFTHSLENIVGVDAATASRMIEVQVGQDSLTPAKKLVETLFFNAIDPNNYRKVGDKEFISGQGDPERLWKNFEQNCTVFISSVIADEFDLKTGDFISLVTNQGQQPFRVAGITTEFNQSGLVMTGSFTDLRRYFGEYEADMFTLKISPSFDVDQIAKAIGNYYEDRKGIQVTTTHAFKKGVLAFYDSLTNLFNVLSWVGLIIGVIGLLNTMSMNILERKRELGMLRALGSLQGQIVRMVLAEALMIGLISAIYGIVFGYILSHVLVAAANLISGYDLHYTFSAQPYLFSLLIGIAISQFATLLPARQASQINIIEALKYE
jgi:putative ABC transport system permease protein